MILRLDHADRRTLEFHRSECVDAALERYWDAVKSRNMALEKAMDNLSLDRIRRMDERAWYEFLHDEYFRWKYTGELAYRRNIRWLRRYKPSRLNELDEMRKLLLQIATTDVRGGLKTAKRIDGLGTAGASGLLALMYPHAFATVDQFVVTAFSEIANLPKATAIADMEPRKRNLKIDDGVVLIEIMRKKARDNNRLFATTTWTPRKIDMVLWGCRVS